MDIWVEVMGHQLRRWADEIAQCHPEYSDEFESISEGFFSYPHTQPFLDSRINFKAEFEFLVDAFISLYGCEL